jgi:multiple sugar transport system permease protein
VVLLAVFLAGPIAWCVYAAFTNTALTGAGASHATFIGLANFRQMFADPEFRQSVVETIIFVLGTAVIGQNLLGLLIAVLMRHVSSAFRTIIGTIVVTAWVLPEIVAGFVWYAYLNDQGTLNQVLHAVHLPQPSWLFLYPLLSAIIANVWRGTAFSMMVYSAAIAEVPPDLQEAAAIDGAGALQRFIHVTLPLIRRSIMTNLMLITLATLSIFTLIFTLTGGGPGDKSETLPLYMYEKAFKFYQIGFGAAAALVLLLIGAVFSVIYVVTLRREV